MMLTHNDFQQPLGSLSIAQFEVLLCKQSADVKYNARGWLAGAAVEVVCPLQKGYRQPGVVH